MAKLTKVDVLFLAAAAASLLLVITVWLVHLAHPTSRPLPGRSSLLDAVKLLPSLNLGSKGSFLSIGSLGSIASIGSTGSILSVGSAGSVLSIASVGGVGTAFAVLGVFSFGGFNLVCSKDWPYGVGQLFRALFRPKRR